MPSLFKSSATKVAKTFDSIPVLPILPISSLSENRQTAVLLGLLTFRIALKEV